jgi:hypothetical protein
MNVVIKYAYVYYIFKGCRERYSKENIDHIITLILVLFYALHFRTRMASFCHTHMEWNITESNHQEEGMKDEVIK